MQPKPNCLLDTNVLIDYACNVGNVIDTLKTLNLHTNLIISNVVLSEIIYNSTNYKLIHISAKEANTLSSFKSWSIKITHQSHIQNYIEDQILSNLFAQKLIPSTEVNDAKIVASCVSLNCPYLVTNDKHILSNIIPIQALLEQEYNHKLLIRSPHNY